MGGVHGWEEGGGSAVANEQRRRGGMGPRAIYRKRGREMEARKGQIYGIAKRRGRRRSAAIAALCNGLRSPRGVRAKSQKHHADVPLARRAHRHAVRDGSCSVFSGSCACVAALVS